MNEHITLQYIIIKNVFLLFVNQLTYFLWLSYIANANIYDLVDGNALFTNVSGLDRLLNKWMEWRVRQYETFIYPLFEGLPSHSPTRGHCIKFFDLFTVGFSN